MSTQRNRLWSARPLRRGSSLPTAVWPWVVFFGLATWPSLIPPFFCPCIFFLSLSLSLSSSSPPSFLFLLLRRSGGQVPASFPDSGLLRLSWSLGKPCLFGCFTFPVLGDSQWGVEGMISERGTTRAHLGVLGFKCCGSVGRGVGRLGKVK